MISSPEYIYEQVNQSIDKYIEGKKEGYRKRYEHILHSANRLYYVIRPGLFTGEELAHPSSELLIRLEEFWNNAQHLPNERIADRQEEDINTTNETISQDDVVTCPICNGVGKAANTMQGPYNKRPLNITMCRTCFGRGKIEKKRKENWRTNW